MKIHFIILYALVTGLLSLALYQQLKPSGLVYVDNAQLFKSFKMKAELEKKYQDTEKQRQEVLDSLVGKLRSAEAGGIAGSQLQLLKEELMYKKQRFDTDNESLMNELNSQIWTRLNDYMKSFGKSRGYTFVFGTSGQGTLMYAREGFDVTTEAIEYMNEKYNGN